MNILTTYFTVNRLFTFVRKGMMYVEFNSITLITVLYSRFLNYAKDVSKVTAQPTILEYVFTVSNCCVQKIISTKNIQLT